MQMKLKPNPKSIQTHKQSQSVNFLWGEMISFYEESVKQTFGYSFICWNKLILTAGRIPV